MSYESFVADLEEAFPELVVRERDLQHVAMGELVLLLQDATSDADRFNALADRVLDFIDRASASDDEFVVNLVAVSFLENLHMLGAACAEFVRKLGTRARRARRQVSGPLCGP
jgi:hypothetical protein